LIAIVILLFVTGATFSTASKCPSAEISCLNKADCPRRQNCFKHVCHDSCAVDSDCCNETMHCHWGICIEDNLLADIYASNNNRQAAKLLAARLDETTPTTAVCEDKSDGCAAMKEFCSNNEMVKEMCPKTCELCGITTPVCEDENGDCPAMKQFCNDNEMVQKTCPKTCELCGVTATTPMETSITASTTIASTITSSSATTSTDDVCEDKSDGCAAMKEFCSNNEMVKEMCPKTCELCGITTPGTTTTATSPTTTTAATSPTTTTTATSPTSTTAATSPTTTTTVTSPTSTTAATSPTSTTAAASPTTTTTATSPTTTTTTSPTTTTTSPPPTTTTAVTSPTTTSTTPSTSRTTPSSSTTTSSQTQGCRDTATNCLHLLSFCNAPLYTNLMHQHCQKTCNFCSVSPSTTSNIVTTTTRPDTGCQDNASNCLQLQSFCNNAIYADLMHQHCQKTCNFCAACSDLASNCAVMKPYCENTLYNELMRKNCRLTCNFC
uniref:ShKT domain-containing protein n=2 Tax=Parascaris univalens TaxID=6257 RepID=A0A915C672_PARUN